ncbi:hypothetical protein ABZX40_30265 [Streptomyces sp. NPDC004610]
MSKWRRSACRKRFTSSGVAPVFEDHNRGRQNQALVVETRQC